MIVARFGGNLEREQNSAYGRLEQTVFLEPTADRGWKLPPVAAQLEVACFREPAGPGNRDSADGRLEPTVSL